LSSFTSAGWGEGGVAIDTQKRGASDSSDVIIGKEREGGIYQPKPILA